MSGSWRIVNIETSICQLLRSLLKSNKSDVTNVSSCLTSLFLSFVCFIHSPRIGFCVLVNLKVWINRRRSEAQLAARTVRFFSLGSFVLLLLVNPPFDRNHELENTISMIEGLSVQARLSWRNQYSLVARGHQSNRFESRVALLWKIRSRRIVSCA